MSNIFEIKNVKCERCGNVCQSNYITGDGCIFCEE